MKLAKPALYDALADLNLCGAVCYIRMRQYAQAKEALQAILSIEHAQTEAILLLCWSLTASIIVNYNEHCSSGSTQGGSNKFSSYGSLSENAEDLVMAQDCLKILGKKPFFSTLVTRSSGLADMKASIKANLGYSSCSEISNFGSETTRATRDSAASNDIYSDLHPICEMPLEPACSAP